MAAKIDPVAVSPSVTLACIEIVRFRRLSSVRLKVDPSTTILVGANNSGKTSILLAIRKFLSEAPSFKSFDISLSQWQTLRELALIWEALEVNPVIEAGTEDDWEGQLKKLLNCMPTLDLWFNAQDSGFHYVAPFISSFKWTGGAVGVRIRLEPASTIDQLQDLAWRYREARQPVKGLEKSSHAWPIDLLDYWLRIPTALRSVVAYKLDPAKGPLATSSPGNPQELLAEASKVDLVDLSKLIRVDFVPAQRGFGSDDEEGRSDSDAQRVGLFSNQLLKFARQHLNVATTGHGHRADLIQAVARAQSDLDEKIRTALEPSVTDVKILGYPGLYDPQEIYFRTRIQAVDLLDHSTAVQYRLDKDSGDDYLPEYSIGLGYQNLQSLSFQLVSFRASRLAPTKGFPPAVHLVMIEEPEAHLHVQVQRMFPDKAHKLMCSPKEDHRTLSSQLLISTHSSHLAHADNFDRLRYVRRLGKQAPWNMPSTEIVNLADAFGSDKATRTFAERYFRVQHTDLLFADGAIFVEGTAERMLVPLFIERDFKRLSERYVSFLDIGGSHAHRLKPLVEKLCIPTVLITDIDPVMPKDDAKGRTIRCAEHINGQAGLECGNDTLTSWHPKITMIEDFNKLKEKDYLWKSESGLKVRFAWQLPVSEASDQWPSSFEDALILSNLDWFNAIGKEMEAEIKAKKKKHERKVQGALAKAASVVQDCQDHAKLAEQLHGMLHGSFLKGDFASTLFERLSAGASIACPPYISGALAWLQEQICSVGEEIP